MIRKAFPHLHEMQYATSRVDNISSLPNVEIRAVFVNNFQVFSKQTVLTHSVLAIIKNE